MHHMLQRFITLYFTVATALRNAATEWEDNERETTFSILYLMT